MAYKTYRVYSESKRVNSKDLIDRIAKIFSKEKILTHEGLRKNGESVLYDLGLRKTPYVYLEQKNSGEAYLGIAADSKRINVIKKAFCEKTNFKLIEGTI
ncbi:MAG: hypothetical protein AABW81_01675 [Nanoarchaeota archaeon]